jgi:putative spermidine/putrescine transport system ATP-binding protein
MLEVVGLSNFEGRFPKQLSGGQQQRVALARALIFNPEIVLLDEPMAALDKKLRSNMQLEILRISKKVGATVISVTHDQEEALVMSDRIALFCNGELAQVGTPVELYQCPRTAFVADFIGDANVLSGQARHDREETIVTGNDWNATLPTCLLQQVGSEASRVTVIVRPETIRVNLGGASNLSNRAVGVVGEKCYLGVEYKLFVNLADGQCLHVRSREMGDMANLELGATVELTWDSADIVAIRT